MRAPRLATVFRFGAAQAVLLAVSCAGRPVPTGGAGVTGNRNGVRASAAPKGDALERGLADYEASRYAAAETELRAVPPPGVRARIGLAKVLLATGRAALAEQTASDTVSATPAQALELTALRAEALRRQGKLPEAIAVLESAAGDPEAREIRVLLG